jgi:hypothetical protein
VLERSFLFQGLTLPSRFGILSRVTVKQYLQSIGSKGGKARSAAKTAACRANAKKPRVRKTRSAKDRTIQPQRKADSLIA